MNFEMNHDRNNSDLNSSASKRPINPRQLTIKRRDEILKFLGEVSRNPRPYATNDGNVDLDIVMDKLADSMNMTKTRNTVGSITNLEVKTWLGRKQFESAISGIKNIRVASATAMDRNVGGADNDDGIIIGELSSGNEGVAMVFPGKVKTRWAIRWYCDQEAEEEREFWKRKCEESTVSLQQHMDFHSPMRPPAPSNTEIEVPIRHERINKEKNPDRISVGQNDLVEMEI